MFALELRDFIAARARIAPHINRTPLLTSRQLSEQTGYDVRLKAELFQRVGSYKIRGPLNKFALMPDDQKAPRRRVLFGRQPRAGCGAGRAASTASARSSAWPPTPRRRRSPPRAATAPKSSCTARSGTRPTRKRTRIGANRRPHLRAPLRRRAADRRTGHARPGDRAGLARRRRDRRADRRRRTHLRRRDGRQEPQPGDPRDRRRVQSTAQPCSGASQAGALETIDCRTIIDGLRVRRVGEINFSVVQRYVDEIVTLPDREIFDAVIWVMERCKLVVEGAAAAPVAALLHGLVKVPPARASPRCCPAGT